MNHFQPHEGAAFEGYYSKFRLPSGSHLALVICSVHRGVYRPYMISITYVSPDSKSHWQREYWPEEIRYVKTSARSFDMRIPGYGEVVCKDEYVSYDIETPDFSIKAKTVGETRESWLAGAPESTPAGILVHAPLPIQWHVHSLKTEIDFSLTFASGVGEHALDAKDRRGSCLVHQEKNWARSFPDKYIWVQAWDDDRRRGLCMAGGEALPGIEAYLLTYTSRNSPSSSTSSTSSTADDSITFTPPWTMSVLGFGPFKKTIHDYANRTLSVDFSNLFTRITIESRAPKDTFFPLSAPLPEGHRSNFACESFAATHRVTVYKRSWPWLAWQEFQSDIFEHGSLEYGGGYYLDAGEKKGL